MQVIDALAAALADLLREDPRRVVLGEDVRSGTMIGITRAVAADPEVAPRVVATPLLPATLLAHAGGTALAGLRPIVVLPSLQAVLEGLAGLREIAQLAWRNGGERTAPVLFLVPCGPGFCTGADAGEGGEGIVARIAGLKLVCAGRRDEIVALVRAAATFEHGEDPTMVLLPRALLLGELDDGASAELGRSPLSAHTLRAGGSITVFAWGPCVETAAAVIDERGLDATLIDVAALQPLDREALLAAARATGKIAIVHAGPRAHGLGAELAALFADDAIYTLDAPILRVTGDDAPLGPLDEWRGLPDADHIAHALTTLLQH